MKVDEMVFNARGMSDGVTARADSITARLAFTMVAYIFAYRAIFGAILISGYVTCGATVIANHHGKIFQSK
jgi:hypothetical protein